MSQPLFASTDTGWTITNFHSEITIHPDTSVSVVETIKASFNNLQKHGIYRIIPISYSTRFGNNLNIRFQLLGVTDQSGRPVPVKQSRQGNNLKLRLGHSDRTLTGLQTYIISYQVGQVVTTSHDQAEFYWNVTGGRWPVPIQSATAAVTAPSGSLLRTVCFTGYFSSADQNCSHSHDDTTAQFSTNQLLPGQGFTISTALDSSLLTLPNFYQKFLWFLVDNWVYTFPFLVLAFMFYL